MVKIVYRYLLAIGVNAIGIVKSVRELRRYWRDRSVFSRGLNKEDWTVRTYPILLERNQDSAILGEYFWQDLFVAKRIIELDPTRHIDVGSRVDGFIGNLACVREVEIFDIRPLAAEIPNVTFTQWT